MRYFHNIYGIIHFSDNLHVTAGFDYGMEQKEKGSSEYNSWYSPVVIIKVNLNNNWSISARGEYYEDENGVIIATGTENGFQTSGFSLNIDYKIRENALWRIEGRTLKSKDSVFNNDGESVNSNTFVTTSIAASF
jgi:hypothetical protein